MRDPAPIDLPVLFPQGRPLLDRHMGCLVFNRSMRASIERLMSFWKVASERQRWLPRVEGTFFRITAIGPSSITAEESDGCNAVRIDAYFEEDEHLTHLTLRMTPLEPLTAGTLIASGYADRWEARLYALADQLNP
jgi:hypothetical protein